MPSFLGLVLEDADLKTVRKSPTLGKWDIRTLPDIGLETGVDLCVAKFAKPFEISQQIEFASCQSPSIVL